MGSPLQQVLAQLHMQQQGAAQPLRPRGLMAMGQQAMANVQAAPQRAWSNLRAAPGRVWSSITGLGG